MKEWTTVEKRQATVSSHRDLLVWQKAMVLVEKVYRMTKSFPQEERFGLSSQIQRAAVSIPSNIAEGQARQSTAEFCQFLSVAMGSRAEVETQTMIAVRLGYVTQTQVKEIMVLLEEISKMLHSLRRKLK